MQIPENTIREIRERTDIADLISSYGVDLRRAGADYVALCPFHNEKTPSFHVHTTNGRYKCFGCGKSGDAIEFLQEYQGMTFVDAVTTLAQRLGIEIKKQEDPKYAYNKKLQKVLSSVADFYHRCLTDTKYKQADTARACLDIRQLPKEAVDSFYIGYAPSPSNIILKWAAKYGFSVQELADAGIVKLPSEADENKEPYHRFTGRLMFPIRDSAGRVVGFSGRLLGKGKSAKYVNSPETALFKKSNILYGLDKAAPFITKSPHREVILCEGQIDTIRMHISGFGNAVAPQGTAFTTEHAAILKRYADSAILVFDDDAAGHKATIRTAGILLSNDMPVRVVSLPQGHDPDSFLLNASNDENAGIEAFRKMLDNAESIISFQCRIEQEKEGNAKSLDAIQRITKAILATVSVCKNAILKDSLLSEAAKILDIPKEALQDELTKTKVKPQVIKAIVQTEPLLPSAPADDNSDDSSDSSDDCGIDPETIPPSPLESAFLSLLAAYEGDKGLIDCVNAILTKAPQLQERFSCSFVRRFVSAFLSNTDEALAVFGESLNHLERPWFDDVYASIIHENNAKVFSVCSKEEIATSFLRAIYKVPLHNKAI